MDYLDLLQWPAMIVTVAAAYLVASRSPRKRAVGFWCFLASNVGLQFCLAALNIRGVYKNE